MFESFGGPLKRAPLDLSAESAGWTTESTVVTILVVLLSMGVIIGVLRGRKRREELRSRMIEDPAIAHRIEEVADTSAALPAPEAGLRPTHAGETSIPTDPSVRNPHAGEPIIGEPRPTINDPGHEPPSGTSN